MYDKACTMQNTANIKNKYQKKTSLNPNNFYNFN